MKNVYLYRYKISDQDLNSAMLEGVTFKKELLEIDNHYRLTVSCKGNSLKAAQLLFKVNENLNGLSVKPFKVLYDGISDYYLSKLFPLFSNLERSLKELLFIVCYASKKRNKQIDKLVKEINDTSFGELLYSLKFDLNFNKVIRDYLDSKYRSKDELLEFVSNTNENESWFKRIGLEYSVINLKSKYLIDLRNDIMHHHAITYEAYVEAKDYLVRAIQEIDYASYSFTQQSRENREKIANSLSIIIGQITQTQEIIRKALSSPGFKAFINQTKQFNEIISSLFNDDIEEEKENEDNDQEHNEDLS